MRRLLVAAIATGAVAMFWIMPATAGASSKTVTSVLSHRTTTSMAAHAGANAKTTTSVVSHAGGASAKTTTSVVAHAG